MQLDPNALKTSFVLLAIHEADHIAFRVAQMYPLFQPFALSLSPIIRQAEQAGKRVVLHGYDTGFDVYEPEPESTTENADEPASPSEVV